MTYTTPEDLSTLTAEPTPSTLDKVKVLYKEGRSRSQRISKILKDAFSQTAVEFKEGRQALSPLAQEVTSETMATVKEQSQKATEALNDAWTKEADSQDLSERISRVIGAVAQSVGKSARIQLLPHLKTQASRLDAFLSDRYGKRYEDIRVKIEKMRNWQTTSEATGTYKVDVNRADTATDATTIEVDSEVIG